MYVQYQRFQLGGRAEEVEVATNPVTGMQYVLLQDVQDVFPTAARFERDGRAVRFMSDEQGSRLEPWRIAHCPETTLQVIPTRQIPFPSSTISESSDLFSSQAYYCHTPASTLLPPQGNKEDWRDYLAQKGVRAVILLGVSVLNAQVNYVVSMRRMGSFSPYWEVVGVGLYLLRLVWFVMLVVLVIQVVWFLVTTPISTKSIFEICGAEVTTATKSTYQRLFDF
ncbi:hypothetical protein EDD21DRAFT_383340 [Dissophora ornata]|nr:hypothetical protein EDD21DRAFT_383340 [Dissophora ornata]